VYCSGDVTVVINSVIVSTGSTAVCRVVLMRNGGGDLKEMDTVLSVMTVME